jgi:terminase large subunit-like protein
MARHTPAESIVLLSKLSLSWFVEKIFVGTNGLPFRLQPFQAVILNMMFTKKFPMIVASRGASKSSLLALYSILKCLLVPGTKVVIASAGYRQAKQVFKYIDTFYKCSPILQEAFKVYGGPKFGSDGASMVLGMSEIVAIPTGDNGERIRGLRANVLIVDEMGSLDDEIFEVVLKPFTAVHANPAQRAAIASVTNRLKSLGANEALIKAIQDSQGFGNQVIIAGTATIRFNHFYRRFRTYKAFIEAKGDIPKIKEMLLSIQSETAGKTLTLDERELKKLASQWHHYAVLQLPYHALPEEFLDEGAVLADKASFSSDRFRREYLAEFPEDSEGFIKRSKIEQATPGMGEQPVEVEIYGDPRSMYVLGLDPARWNDNFGLVVLKLTPRGFELVYCDAWNKTEWGVSVEKIRDVCRRFNIVYVAMDSEGGGSAVQELLCKKHDHMGHEVPAEDLIWPIHDQLQNLADRASPGRFMLEMVNFTSWTPRAAHNLEANIEQRRLLFPGAPNGVESIVKQYRRYAQVDNVSKELEEELSQMLWGLDSWEADENKTTARLGAYDNISECINEVCAIVKEVTVNGVERFILPKLSGQHEGLDVRRRDRFSALLLANYAASVYMGHGHRRVNTMTRTNLPSRSEHKVYRKGKAVWFNPNR